MFRKLSLLVVVFTFILVVSGAFVRLSDAGLACPDWPSCFGELVMPSPQSLTGQAQLFPNAVPNLGKTRLMMSYRYLAALTGLLIFITWITAFFETQARKIALILSTGLLLSMVLQGAVGMAAVQFKLMPILVSAQLLAGLFSLSIAFWMFLRVNPQISRIEHPSNIGLWAKFSLLMVLIEILLGSWTGANYAALACPDFPTCLDTWWPRADYLNIFSVFHGFELNYQGGILSHETRIAIHWFHRIGAALSFVVLGGLALALSSVNHRRNLRKAGVLLSALLLVQIALGIGIVLFRVPLLVAVGHSAVAAILLLTVLFVNFWISREIIDETDAANEAELIATALPDATIEELPALRPTNEITQEIEVPAEPVNLFERLRGQLKKTRSGLTEILAAIPLGKKEIDAELLEDIESTLILADIGVDATREIIDKLTSSVERKQLSDASALGSALRENLLAMLKPCDQPLAIEADKKPFVILVIGVNGVGKTTTIGKLAKRLQSHELSVMLAAGDTFRAAAVEQLQTWGERNGVPVIAQQTGADSASVVFDALKSAQARGIDVLIADTAGRLHTKDNLMEELRKVKRIMCKLDPKAPHEVLLVLDACTGQNALSQAEQFHRVIGLTGIALTKLDGTAKGGIIFALAKKLAVPIRYIGVGEGINDLQDFDAENFINALFSTEA